MTKNGGADFTTDGNSNWSAFLLAPLTPPVTGLYFAAAGNDANACTQAAPCQTIAKANTLIIPTNGTLYFNGGDTFTGCPIFSYATNIAGPGVIVTSYGTGTATVVPNCPSNPSAVDINGINNFTWTNITLAGAGATNLRGGILIENGSPVPYTSGVTVANSDISGFSAGQFGCEIFVIGWASNGSQSSIKNINILNNNLHGATTTSPDPCGVNGFTSANPVQNLLIQGNTVSNMGGPATNTAGALECNGVNGCTILGNTIHDIGANVTSCGGPSGIQAYASQNGLIEFNEVYNVKPTSYTTGCDWDAIDAADGGVSNFVAEYNYTHNNFGSAFLFYCANVGNDVWNNNTYRYNISENDGPVYTTDITNGIFEFGGYGGCPTGAVGNFYNNTIYSNIPGTGSSAPAAIGLNGMSSGAGPTSGFIGNNIIAVTPASGNCNFVSFANSTISPTTAPIFGANDYYCIGGGTNRWYHINGSTSYTSLATWQAVAPSGDVGATTANPTLVSPGSSGTCGGLAVPSTCPAGYKLQVSSTLLGAGFNPINPPFNATALTMDYFGVILPPPIHTAFSIGAAQGAPAAVSTAPTVTITAPATGTYTGNVTLTATCAPTSGVLCQSIQFQSTTNGLGNIGPAQYSASGTASYVWNTIPVTNAAYVVTAVGQDTATNATTSASHTLTLNNVAPTFSAISSANPGSTAVYVTWTTSSPASTQCFFGLTSGYGSSTTLDPTKVTAHSCVLTGLTAGTVYHYKLEGTDAGSRTGDSTDQTVTTHATFSESCAESTAFMNREAGLDATHITATDTLICGEVTDSDFATLDGFYLLATANTYVASLNAISSNYSLKTASFASSAPTFTADNGYAGDGATQCLDTGFNPVTVGGNFALNSASLFGWTLTASNGFAAQWGAFNGIGAIANPAVTTLYVALNRDGNANINIPVATDIGFFSGSRTSSTNVDAVENATAHNANVQQSQSMPNSDLFINCEGNGGANYFDTAQVGIFGFGASRTPTQMAARYARFHAYMQTIAGVP